MITTEMTNNEILMTDLINILNETEANYWGGLDNSDNSTEIADKRGGSFGGYSDRGR